MVHEKPDESFHWKKRLGEIDHLPGESVHDKTASWEKLHDRLGKKPRTNKIMWYWAAAACLCILAGLQWIKVKEKDTPVVTVEPLAIPQRSSDTSGIIKSNPDAHATHTVIKKRQSNSIAVKEKNKPVFTSIGLNNKNAAMDPDTVKKSLPPFIVNTVKPVDTIALITVAPQRKKLRVVHINELGKPMEQEIQFARSNVLPAFEAKVFRQDRSAGFSLSRNFSDNIVKIKLSPSN
ncbi:MAG: hypothetical protein H7122_15385 [Chitinophagaceae bacterium]|nr:hypothetical protein [Chitinophagaceae bacterium]